MEKLLKLYHYVGEILDFVLYNRALGYAVTSNEVIFKLRSMDEGFRENSQSTLQKWWYCFMKRHFLTFRRNTHISQKLPVNYFDKFKNFFIIIWNLEANIILNWIQ